MRRFLIAILLVISAGMVQVKDVSVHVVKGTTLARDGRSLEFHAPEDMATVTDNFSIQNVFRGGGTLEAWIYPRSDGGSNNGGILDKDIGALKSGYTWRVWGQSGESMRMELVRVWTDDGVSSIARFFSPVGAIKANEWNHVVVTYDEGEPSNIAGMYIQGLPIVVEIADIPSSGFPHPDVGANLIFGNSFKAPNAFDGFLDEIRMWSTVRTEKEIQDNMRWELQGAEANLIGYWPIENGWGTTIFDKSLLSNNGVIAGAKWHNNGNRGRSRVRQ